MKFKKILIFTLIFIFFSNSFVLSNEIENEDLEYLKTLETSSTTDVPIISSSHAIVLERLSKKILYGKNEFEKTAMASTTKIMTAIIALENSNLSDEIVISKNAAKTSGSTLGIIENQKMTMENLLYGLLLRSGNDCAVAIAEYIATNLNGFAKLMNQKAQELNLKNTNFVTPHGLDNDMHYTTAYDLAILADYALQNETFRKIVSTKSCTIQVGNTSRTINNTNELLGYLDGVYGIKTGYTGNAGRCLVTACKRNNLDIIVIVLGAGTKKQRTQDSINLINYIYKNFEIFDTKKLITESFNNFKNISHIHISNSNSKPNFILENISSYKIPIKKSDSSLIKCQIFNINYLTAPIPANTQIGVLQIVSNNNILLSQKIYISNFIYKNSLVKQFLKILKQIK